jgi:hypothetical protein
MPREIGKTKRKESNTMRRQRLCGFIHLLYPKFQRKKQPNELSSHYFLPFRFIHNTEDDHVFFFVKRSACDAEFFISKPTVGCNRQKRVAKNLLIQSNKRVDMSI